MIKAVGLFSGGLDSSLSAKLLIRQRIKVHALYFRQPWMEKDPREVRSFARSIGAAFHVIDLGRDYLDMLISPNHGYGKAFNPCTDCHHFMVKKAGRLMHQIGAQFVFTGEVLGQRPMSQRRQCLELVEKDSGLEGYLLRPLSAQLLEETVPEREGWVDRSRLLAISGRSRSQQLALAREGGIERFFPTGGGCLITEKPFGRRMKDFLGWPYRDPKETAVLKWGRYFRLNRDFPAVIGRDKRENEFLSSHAMPDDVLIRLADTPGPLLLLKALKVPDDEVLSLAGGIVQRYSSLRKHSPQQVLCMKKSDPDAVRTVLAKKLSKEDMLFLEGAANRKEKREYGGAIAPWKCTDAPDEQRPVAGDV